MSKSIAGAVNSFYEDRASYSIIGLTGVAGSGCSSFAKLVCDKDQLFRVARKPEMCSVDYPPVQNVEKQRELKLPEVGASIGQFVDNKKYEICYKFLAKNYESYELIKYTKLLWLYLILYSYHNNVGAFNGETLKKDVEKVLSDKYRPSITSADDKLKSAISYSQEERERLINGIVSTYLSWEELAEAVNELGVDWVEKRFQPSEARESKKILSEFFFDAVIFREFVEFFTESLAGCDYYSSCFFYHRLATQVRAIRDPFSSYDEWYNQSEISIQEEDLYSVIRLFVVLLDGRRENKKPRRVIIDSVRNSAEAVYLRERYSGFYLVAIHDENSKVHLRNKVADRYPERAPEVVSLYYDSILKLNAEEAKTDDFDRGYLASPDIDRVIERAEIHIRNIWSDADHQKEAQYQHMAEQWIRYASLILNPGLVTPTTAERCMAVAYTAKFNSGCLSRQVGAAITNKDGSIRSIGWNEVPYGQVSCALRSIDKILDDPSCKECSFTYSVFERTGAEKYKDEKSFIDKLKEDYGENLGLIRDKLRGRPFSYCFKSLHNYYEGEKNQVFTRSLHAEENAILQMAKHGGEALKDGVIYVTASPCELCSKKLYQIGVRRIVYIDPYPGIARQHIISAGFKQPALVIFEGAIGATYFKLYQPFMPYKDEIGILIGENHQMRTSKDLLTDILNAMGEKTKPSYTKREVEDIVGKIKEAFKDREE